MISRKTHTHVRLERRVLRATQPCGFCKYPQAPLQPLFVPVVDDKPLAVGYCTERHAALAFPTLPFQVVYSAR